MEGNGYSAGFLTGKSAFFLRGRKGLLNGNNSHSDLSIMGDRRKA
jgi:hypothetical protein